MRILVCSALLCLVGSRAVAQQTVTAIDQKSGIFWVVSYSGSGTLTTGNYLLGEAWVSVPTGHTVSITSIGKYNPGTMTVDASYTGPRLTSSGGHRDGMMKNPAGGGVLTLSAGNDILTSTATGYDDRSPNGLAALFSTTVWNSNQVNTIGALGPGDVVVSTVSNGESVETSCVTPQAPYGADKPWESVLSGICSPSPIRLAAVLTCVSDSTKPAYADVFRKPYYMPSAAARENLANLRASTSIDWSKLPRVGMPSTTYPPPSYAAMKQMFNKVWLEHISGEGNSFTLFPTQHMGTYGEYQREAVSSAALLAMTNPDASIPNGPLSTAPSNADFREMIYGMLQVGIDTFGLMQDPTHSFEGTGGQVGGRKFLVAFAGHLFGNNRYTGPVYSMNGPWTVERHVNNALITDYPRFKEETQFFSAPDQFAAPSLRAGSWDWQGSPWMWSNAVSDRLRQVDPPTQWTSGGRFSEGYFFCCSVPPFVGMALALRMLDLEATWANPGFFGVIDRYMIQEHQNAFAQFQAAGISPQAGRYYRWPKELNSNNPYLNPPVFSLEFWDAYRWANNQGTVELRPANVTFDDRIAQGTGAACPLLHRPVMLTQHRAQVSGKVLAELYSNEQDWLPVCLLVAGNYYTAGFSLQQTLFPGAANDATLHIDPAGAILITGLTNAYGYLGQVLDMPSSSSAIGTSLAIQTIVGTPSLLGLGGSVAPCVGTSNVLFFAVEP